MIDKPLSDHARIKALEEQLASLTEARDGFKEEADALRRNYLRETKELAEFADKAEAKLSALTAAYERVRGASKRLVDAIRPDGYGSLCDSFALRDARAALESALAPLEGTPQQE